MKMGWFGRDTPESLSKEVFSFFDKFRRLGDRIVSLIDSYKGLLSVEDTTHQRNVENESSRHADVESQLNEQLETLREALRLAEKVVKFAEED